MAKPKCIDFLVPAIRHIRQRPSNMKPRTKAGLGIKRLWTVVSEAYSEEEFRQALADLLQKGTIVAVWTVESVTVREVAGNDQASYHGRGVSRITSIPASMPFNAIRWWRHEDKFMSRDERKTCRDYESIHKLLLYVAADGLPQRVPSLKKKISKTAREIIAAMRKHRR